MVSGKLWARQLLARITALGSLAECHGSQPPRIWVVQDLGFSRSYAKVMAEEAPRSAALTFYGVGLHLQPQPFWKQGRRGQNRQEKEQ